MDAIPSHEKLVANVAALSMELVLQQNVILQILYVLATKEPSALDLVEKGAKRAYEQLLVSDGFPDLPPPLQAMAQTSLDEAAQTLFLSMSAMRKDLG